MSVISFPTQRFITQRTLGNFYETSTGLQMYSRWLLHFAARPDDHAEHREDLLITAQRALDLKRILVNTRDHIRERLVAGARVETGMYSLTTMGGDPTVRCRGASSFCLPPDWSFLEKEWASLKCAWSCGQCERIFDIRPEDLIGKQAREFDFFPREIGDVISRHDEEVQALTEAQVYTEIVLAGGRLISRDAVRFPIISHEDMLLLLEARRAGEHEASKVRHSIRPFGLGVIAWNSRGRLALAR